jgi:hypothetical protein
MTKLASAFGTSYAEKRKHLAQKTFELGGHIFTVRLPLVAESDALYVRITTPEESRIDAVYKEITATLVELKDQATEEFEFKENDILINGRSMRNAAKTKVMTETRILEYIKLLVPENPENSLADITYEDIEAEWPTSVQIQLVDKIGEVISPSYKESRKN